MSKLVWLLVLIFAGSLALHAEVLFFDNFDRPDGPVGNGWTNVGSPVSAISANAMRLESNNGMGIRREFDAIDSGIYYIKYDWKIAANNWYADCFPTAAITHLIMDDAGNVCYDVDGTLSDPVLLRYLGLNTWATVLLRVNLDTDLFSVWIDGVLAADNIPGTAASSFYRFTFRAGLGATVTQYVDNFVIYNDISPAIPSNFTAIGSVNEIALAWNAPASSDLLTYRIYRDTASPAATLLTEIDGALTSYVDNGAAPNTDYLYRIKAVSVGTIESGFSSEAMAHLQPQINVTPQNITFNVGYGYTDSTYVTISNTGNYPLEWNVQGASNIPNNGMIAYYNYNGNSYDESGYGRHGTVNGAVLSNDRLSNLKSAYYFSGPDNITSNATGFPTGGQPRSVSFWFNLAQFPTECSHIITYGQCGTSNAAYEVFIWTDHKLRFAPWGNYILGNTVLATNTWYHGVVTNSGNNVKIYLNGNLDGSGSTTINTSIGTGVLNIGSLFYPDGTSREFKGHIDEVVFYDREISADEVMSIYQYALPSYLSISLTNGLLSFDNNENIKICVNANLLSIGNHIDTLRIETNDPVTNITTINVTTNVLPPVPVITPDPLIVNLNVENPTRDMQIQLQNQGQGKLIYSLSGTDDYGNPNQLPAIDGFTAMGAFNGHRYYHSNNTMNWYQAKSICEANGGHLATISDINEQNFIKQHLVSEAWIGYTDEGHVGTWVWVTGEPVGYTCWAPDEPNSGGAHNWAHMWGPGHPEFFRALGDWNDIYYTGDGFPIQALLEYDDMLDTSILSFNPDAGVVESDTGATILMNADGSALIDGQFQTSINIDAEGGIGPFFFPVTVNVDFTPPLQVDDLAVDEASTDANQIGITWSANTLADSVVAYRIYRRGRDEANWSLKGTVPATQLWFIDNQFTGLDSTYVWYRVRAEDWVGNLSAEGDSLQAALERFLAPENLQIAAIANRDVQLSWNPVTQTISGLPGTPSCYIVYKSQYPAPLTEFDFLDVSFSTQYIHPWALYFQPANRLFYVVTAYGGNMSRLDALLAEKQGWKYDELQLRIAELVK